MEEASSCSRSRERLGLRFTIDYLLYNKGDKQGSREDSDCPSDRKEEVEEVWEKEEMEEEVEAKVTIEDLEERDAEKVEEKAEGEEEKKEEVPSPWDSSSDRDRKSPRCPGEGLERSDLENQEAEVPEEESRTNEGGLEGDKPPHSYIALISMAILSSLEKKLLLCDIYQWIMDHYPYFKSKDRNWRNSVRHNLSLNECFMKAGRSDNGKGHYWAIHPSNFRDFSNGDYHCRRARRRIRRMGAQPLYAPLGTPGPYGSPLLRLQGAGGTCWCCPPPAPLLPRSCLPPWVYWCWAGLQKKNPPGLLAPTLQVPTLQAPTLQAPTLQAPTLQAPTLQATTLQAPTLQAPTLQAPTLQAPIHPVWLRG